VLRTLIITFCLVAMPAAAQGLSRQPTLIIDLNEPGHLRAWLSLPIPVPDAVAEAFRQAMGCPAAAPAASTPPTISVSVECTSPVKKEGLRWSGHWDFTALNGELMRAGATALEIDISHSRYGFSKVLPTTISEHDAAGFNISYHGDLPLDDFHDITLEMGYPPKQIWLLGIAAAAIMLLPLLLFPARAGGLLNAVAGATGLFCVGATTWIWVVLSINAAAMAPLPWNIAMVSGPPLVAVWTGSRIAGGRRRRLLFWRGARVVAVMVLIVGIFSAPSEIPLWATCCGGAVILSVWRQRRAGSYQVQPLAEGELWKRIRELAARAGTTVKSVQLLTGGEDLPAAFATRFRGILLTSGLLSALSRREVDAIVAHELSHVRRPRTAVVRGVAYLFPVAMVVMFFVPSSVQWIPLLGPPAFLLHRGLRRWNERQADADAVTWSGDAEALITGLVRVTRAHNMPIEWPGWVKPLMPHPSTMARVRAAAAQAHIPEGRFQELLSASAGPPVDVYSIVEPSADAGTVFTPAERQRLNFRLSMVGLAVPIIFGVASPFTGYAAALLSGAASALLATEWVLLRARSRARARLSERPGVFAGFSPSVEPRIYDGSYDYDWGFAVFEDDCLVFRGDRRNWTANRSDVQRIWLANGPFQWFKRPMVCFQTKSGRTFCLRPFDGAFGPAAPRAAARLFEQSRAWNAAAQTCAPTDIAESGPMPGQPPPQYTWRMFLRSLPRYGAFTLVTYWLILALYPNSDWSDPGRMLGPLAITWSLALFVAYPGLRRARNAKVSR